MSVLTMNQIHNTLEHPAMTSRLLHLLILQTLQTVLTATQSGNATHVSVTSMC